MQNPNLYFVGKGGAGKTHLCNYLIKRYNYVQAKMANSVYMLAIKYLGMNENKKDRHLLQYLGTDVARDRISQDIWVNRFIDDVWIAQQTARDLYQKELVFCSDDVRFENEHQALKGAGWIGIYLDVPDELRISRLERRDGDAQVNHLEHRSETEIDKFKDELIKVDVSGSLEQSYQNLEETVEHIRKEQNEQATN